MKKIIIIILVIFITGCKNNSARDIVSSYLDEYHNLSTNIINEINNAVDLNDKFSKKNKKIYKDILKRQYKDLKYKIIREEYDNDIALITVNVNVYDLNKAEEEALLYLTDHLSEFYNEDNTFNENKYISYKLDLMSKTNIKVNYDILFTLRKKNNNWILDQPTESDLEKIHGLYKESE